jgi:hypothetical protein
MSLEMSNFVQTPGIEERSISLGRERFLNHR